MAQTDGQVSQAHFVLEISTDGSSWTDISGVANSVDQGTQDRMHGETHTADGDTALNTFGKRGPMEITMNIVFTDDDAEGYQLLRGYHEADKGTAFYLRISPNDGTNGSKRMTSDLGKIIRFGYPANDANSGDPIVCEVVFKTAKLTTATIS